MSQYLEPTNDIAFKKIFGDKQRLLSFLNNIMRLPAERKILEFEYISQEQIPDLGQYKRGIVDIKCKDASGNIYIIEMQNGWAENFLKRVQFYGAGAITSQVARGKPYADIAPVVLILILRGIVPLKDKNLDVISFHRTVEVSTGKQFLKDLSYVFVELDRFEKDEHELETYEDQWLYFLSKCDISNQPPQNLHDEDILSAYDMVDQFNWTPLELEIYMKVKLAHDTEQLGLKAEYKRGEEKGIEQGIEQGEKQKAVEMAKLMFLDHESIEKIMKYTNLTKEEILAIN